MSDTPKKIGPYRILAVLGQGGMGIVYRAQHQTTGSLAALKTVSIPNEDVLRCLRREIRALARISHPGVVRILDDGVEGGIPWYAMELVDGVTLRDDDRHWALHQTARTTESEPTQEALPEVTLERAVTADLSSRHKAVDETMVGHSPAFRPSDPTIVVPPARPVAEVRPVIDAEKLTATLSLIRRLCWSLAFVHGEGIVHRDLKPENVLVRRDGSPVLMDFGLAVHLKRERSRDHLGLNAGVSGTVFYMAPEQLRGQFVDARADLYALGCILYELVTGRPPFVGEQPVQIAYQHFRTPPVPPSEKVEGLPVDLDRLILRLLAKEPPERFGHADDVAAALERLGANGASAPKERPKAYLYRPGMAGRGAILQQLAESLTRLEEEQGDVVLIGGESGVGKTRLVLEVSREASNRKMRILTAECLPTSANDTEASGGLALHPFQQALRAVADRCRERGLDETERLLGRRGKVLARFEPTLIGLQGQDAYPQPAELPPAAAQLRLYSYLAATLSALAEDSPLLFVLDDLQWADDLTLGFLEFLLRGNQMRRMKLLVVATFRTEAVGVNSRSSLSSLLEAARDHRVELGRLGGDSVASMVGDMLAVTPPPSRLVEFLARQSEGNPFFVAEYLKTAVAQDLLYRDERGRWNVAAAASGTLPASEEAYEELPLPNSVRKLVSRRLKGLPAGTRALIDATAVVGREVSAILVWRMLRLEVPEILDATNDALRRQILEEVQSGAALRFVHDKIREVAYEELSPQQRAALHRAAAEGIEGFSFDAVDGDFGALAFHWEQAGEKDRARRSYLQAARIARSLYSHVEAERLYRAFQRLVTVAAHETIEVRNELAREVLSLRGDNAAAIEEHLLALGEAQLIRDRLGEARSLQGLSTTNRLSGRVREAREYGEQALAIYRELGDRPAEGTALMVVAAAYLALGQLQRAQELFESALEIDREVGNSVHAAVTLSNLAVIAREQGNHDEAESLQTQALELHRTVRNRRSEGITLENLGTLALDCGNLADALRYFEVSLSIHREVGDRLYEAFPLNGLALLKLQQGSAEEARALWRQALANAREVNSKLTEAQILRTGAAIHRLGLADLEEARSLVDQSEALARELGNPLEIVACLCERGHLELARGHFATQVLLEAEGLAAETDAGPESRSTGTIARLRRAEGAFEAGKRVWRGTAPEDLPPGLRERLESEASRQTE